MNDLAGALYRVYWDYAEARKPKNMGQQKAPEPEPYSALEVRRLVDDIVNKANDVLAERYLAVKP
jgi:hypothetical protein